MSSESCGFASIFLWNNERANGSAKQNNKQRKLNKGSGKYEDRICPGEVKDFIFIRSVKKSVAEFINKNKNPPNFMCTQHNEEYKKYCKNCKGHQCSSCINDSRFTHEYLSLQLIQEEITAVTTNIKTMYNSLDENIKKLMRKHSIICFRFWVY